MKDFLTFILFVIVIFTIAFAIRKLRHREIFKARWPYSKKRYLMTEAESKFFNILEELVGNKLYVFPQIHLPSLLLINAKGKNWWHYFCKINQKSVDFVLCDKQNIEPLLVIELDDSSHNQEQRIERDEFVNEIFNDAGMPILHVKAKSFYDLKELESHISGLLLK